MNKKNFIYTLALCMAIASFTGCKDDDDPALEEKPVPSEFIYVLNAGLFNSNNASLSMCNLNDGTVVSDVFETRNGRRLGNTGQDIIIYGSKMYIAMYGESTIEVTDLDAKSIKQISTEGPPRSFAVDGGKVYVTYFNGYVARIDTASLAVEDKVPVGRNPEQLTVAGGKLYVANSGGLEIEYDKTVSVVDIATFTETKKINVVINPCNIVSDGNNGIYLVSMGDYGSVPNTLQEFDENAGTFTVMTDINGTSIANVGSTLYSVFAQWSAPTAEYYSYDMKEKKILSDHFIGDTEISGPNPQVSTDRTFGDIFITTTDYKTDGDIHVFDGTGRFVGKFGVGMCPIKAVRVKK
jgi:YVTN family beta-propeller protein